MATHSSILAWRIPWMEESHKSRKESLPFTWGVVCTLPAKTHEFIWIKKRWQEYTEELYNKDLHDPDNHDGVITDLEPDILECEVEWALESITRTKLVEVIEFQLSYSKS